MKTKPYLIQRGTFKSINSSITGIDQLITYDYMGSSEFEYGALPKSLKQMCIHIDEYEIYKTDHTSKDNEGLFILCKPEDTALIKKFIDEIIENEYSWNLKEYPRLKQSLNKERFYNYNMWWDIDNHYMFCIGKQNCKNLITAIKAVRERKRNEGVEGWY